MRESKFKKFISIIFIIILFVCIGLTSGKSRKITIFENLISEIVIVPQKLFTYSKAWISNDMNFFELNEELKIENEKLKKENEELNARLINYEVILSENLILKEHVNLTNSYPDYKAVVADVVSKSPSNWEEVYVINRGSKDGVKPNMVVVAEEGLVGYISEVTNDTSKVVSILDPGNSVSARVTRTRDLVIAKGSSSLNTKNQLKINKIPTSLTLVEGDRLETSGLGGRYPRGIPIGEVVKFDIKKNPIENDGTLKTCVDFNKLETVAIIIEEYKQTN